MPKISKFAPYFDFAIKNREIYPETQKSKFGANMRKYDYMRKDSDLEADLRAKTAFFK